MEFIRPQTGIGFTLKKGERLKVVDPEGQQVSDFFCFNQNDTRESLSSGRSIDYADTIFLSRGHQLYSNRSNVMAVIEEDTCGRNDFLMTPCSLRMFQLVSKTDDYHPSCHENLAKAFSGFDIGADAISTTFNIFMNVGVKLDGTIKIGAPPSKAGDHVIIRAEQNLIVGLTACSHEETNSGVCKPIEWQILGH